MTRQNLIPIIRATYLAAAIFIVNTSCQPDIGEAEPPIEPAQVVVAQFEPNHPIPQLRLIPSPSILAEKEGSIDFERIKPAPCEGSTPVQCLAFVPGGWPVNLFPTLNFSAPLEEGTLGEGIQLFEVAPSGALVKIENLRFDSVERPLPPPACKEGDNNSQPEQKFTDAELTNIWGSEYIDLVIQPEGELLKPSTTYVIVATRALRGKPPEGQTTPRPVEPSNLFYLLNQKDVFDNNGNLVNGTLLAEVRNTALAQRFPNRSFGDLNPDEVNELQQVIDAIVPQLRELYQFVSLVTGTLITQNAIASRDEIVIANIWTTGTPPSEALLDPEGSQFPTNIQVPFPNDPLFLTRENDRNQVRIQGPESASTLVQQVLDQLNTLDGFGMTTPIQIPSSQYIDPTSLEGNVMMVELDDQNAPIEVITSITVDTTSPNEGGPPSPQIIILPTAPLKPNTTYAVGLRTGIKDIDGKPLIANSLFSILKYPGPILTDSGSAIPELRPLLECAAINTSGELVDADLVAGSVEVGLNRSSWQIAVQALAQLDPPVDSTQLVMAFPYTTQSLTQVIDDIAFSSTLPVTTLEQPPVEIPILDTHFQPLCGQLEDDTCDAVIANYGSGFQAHSISLSQYSFTAGSPQTGGGFITPESLVDPTPGSMNVFFISPLEDPPGTGWPTVIFQHGFGSTKEAALLIAKTFTEAGYAIAGLDLPYHGERTLAGEACPEDNCESGDGFLSLNLLATRDSLRQTTLDQLSLIRFLKNNELDRNGLPLIDGENISYVGQSLGGIAGANLQAYLTPEDLTASVLNSAGGGLIDIVENSASRLSRNFVAALNQRGICEYQIEDDPDNSDSGPASGCKPTPLYQLFIQSARWVLEPSNPLLTANAVTTLLPGRPLIPTGIDTLLLQSITPDQTIPPITSQSLARAYELEHTEQFQSTVIENANVDVDCHPYFFLPVCGICPEEALCRMIATQSQAVSFLTDLSIITDPPERLSDEGILAAIDCNSPCDPN